MLGEGFSHDVSKRLELLCHEYQPETCPPLRPCGPIGYAQAMTSVSIPPTEVLRVLATKDANVAAEVRRDEATLRRTALGDR